LNQLGNTWLKSLMVFFIIAGLGATAASFQRIASSMGWAALASALVVLPGFVMTGFGADPDDRLAGIGSLSNPNEIAFHLWLGMPFLVLLAVRSRTWKKVLLIGVCLFELGLIVKTVSREGLLISLVVITIAMVRVSLSNKVKICVAAFVLMTVAIGTLPQESLSRYLTLFSSDVSGAAAASAQLSSRTRKQKLKESIELTLQHPIFGVGMGVFMPASVELAKSNRDRPEWAMSHNSYTQVSSELGFPGFLILLSIYAAGFVQIWRMDRDARRAGRDDVRQICTALFVALLVLSLHFCFDAMAYVFYLPLVMGIIQAFTMAYKGLRVAQTDSVIATENVLSQPKWRTANTVAGGAALDRRNPYRFGRRRSESR
jgi:O-antigen ligase